MTKKTLLAAIVLPLMAICSCDEETANVGNSISDSADLFAIATDSFQVSSRSLVVDSVISRSEYSYLGRIKDPETGSYITSDYMSQFTLLENESNAIFPPKDSVASLIDNEIVADSCVLNVVVNKWQGDSLAALKLSVFEIGNPVEEGKTYYTNFDPAAKGHIREDGLHENKIFSIVNLQLSDSLRKVQQSGSYYEYVSIPLNKEYTDKDGNTYNNYGTYLMRTYYAHPEYFKNSYNFIHKVCPGFYFKITDGLGLMNEVSRTQLMIYFRGKEGGKTYVGSKTFNGTEEVLQTTRITNDKKTVARLASDNSCTYLKTPAGIFTEVTLPIDDIKRNHENDTITSAKIVFNKMNTQNDLSNNLLQQPTQLLMVEKDSLYSFFENLKVTDNKTSYLATYSSTKNTYTYSNISNLINHLYKKKQAGGSNYTATHPNWNKVVLVPVKTVTTSSTSYYQTTTTITGINNEMSLTSVRLVGGSENAHTPIHITVIYSRNQ